MRTFKSVVALGIACLCAGTAAHADNTGIYAGLSVGQAETDFSNDVLDDAFDGTDTAFKLFLGYRILDWVGVEAGYVDLGEITPKSSQPGLNRFRLEEAGFNVFGVLYWDIDVAPVDLFAKAGFMVTQLHLTQDTLFGSFDDTDNTTDLAWGIGAQVRFDQLAVRLEYERFDFEVGSIDSPDMVSLGATWTFF